VIADRTAYRTYAIVAEPNRRLINLYTERQADSEHTAKSTGCTTQSKLLK